MFFLLNEKTFEKIYTFNMKVIRSFNTTDDKFGMIFDNSLEEALQIPGLYEIRIEKND